MAPPHTQRPRIKVPYSFRGHFFGSGITKPPPRQPACSPFSKLPNELLLLIGEALPVSDIYHLVQTSHRFHPLLLSHLQKLACASKLLSTTALFYAAAFGDVAFVRLLLTKGTDIRVLEYTTSCSSSHYDTIHETPDETCDALFEFVLEESVDLVLWYEGEEFEALRWAIVTEDKALATVLLERGAKTTFRTITWPTQGFLHTAVLRWKWNMVQFIIEKGIGIDTFDTSHRTALQIAIQHRGNMAKSKAMVMMLLEHGANVNVYNEMRKSILHQVTEFKDWCDVVKMVIKKGARVNIRDAYGYTALHIAAKMGHMDMASVLLAAGADAMLEDYDEKTPLHWAVVSRRENMAYALGVHIVMGKATENSDSDSD